MKDVSAAESLATSREIALTTEADIKVLTGEAPPPTEVEIGSSLDGMRESIQALPAETERTDERRLKRNEDKAFKNVVEK